ncbi:MAG: hypothetical protein QOD84_922, partial [Acidobacteriaceae bacterium]
MRGLSIVRPPSPTCERKVRSIKTLVKDTLVMEDNIEE